MLAQSQPVVGWMDRTRKGRLLQLPKLDPFCQLFLVLLPFLLPTVVMLVHLGQPIRFHPVAFAACLFITLFSKHLILRISGTNFDLEAVAFLASLMIVGPFWTLVITAAGVFWYEHFIARGGVGSTSFWKNLANLATVLLSLGTAAVLYQVSLPLGVLGAVTLAGLGMPLFNALIMASYFAALQHKSLRTVWRENQFSLLCGVYIASIPFGYLLGRLFLFSPTLIILFVPPFLMLYRLPRSLLDIQHEMGMALQVVGDILEERDEYTYGHTLRVADYSRMIAEEMKLKPEQVETCVVVGRLHDIGKIAVQDEVLKKDGALSKEEYHHIQEHVRIIPELFPRMDLFGKLLHIAMYHHERYDGQGYPFGVKGEAIPLEARIVAVADAWDAMTSQRVYRANLSEDKALQVLRNYSGAQWDPKVIEAFFKAHGKGRLRAEPVEAA